MHGRARALVFVAAGSLLLGCGSTQGNEPMATENGASRRTDDPGAENRPAPRSPRPSAGEAWVIFGADTVVAEVARTPDQRAEGLMYREEVPDGTGMLFVYTESDIRSFWMNNTYVALDIAFMDAGLRVVDIQQMEPETTTPHESAGPFMMALEVRQGWFQEQGIGVGDVAVVEFGPTLGR